MRKYKIFQFLLVLCFSFVALFACTETKNDSSEDTSQTSEADETVGTPTNLTVTEGILTWDAVTGAENYVITIDGNNYTVNSNRFNLNELELEGELIIQVKAVKGGSESSVADVTHTFVSLDALKDEVYEKALAYINEDYEPDMQESDFDFEYEYQSYLQISKLARAFAESSVNVSLTEEEITHAIEVIETFEMDLNSESLVALAPAFDILEELNLSAYEMAYIVTHMASEYITILLDTYNGETNTEETTDVIVVDDSSTASGVVVEEDPLVDDDATVSEVYDEPVYDPSLEMEEMIEHLEALNELMEEDIDAFIDGLEVVINYMMNVSGEVDADFLQNIEDTINNTDFSITEIFVLKNEVVAVLEESLPSVEDFEKLYTLSVLLTELIALDEEDEDVDYTALIHAQAVSTHYTNKLMIQFIKGVDEDTYNEIQTIIANLMIIDEEYETQRIDIEVAVELVLYADQYMRTFITENQTDFEQLNNAYENETVKTLMVESLKESILESIEQTYDPYEGELSKETVINMVNNIFDHLDLYEQLNALSEEIGWDIYDQFIETEGQIIIDFYQLTQSDPTAETFPADAQTVFTQLITYLELGELTQEEFNLIVEAAYEIVKYPIMEETGYTETEMETISSTTLPLLAEGLYTLSDFRMELLKTLDTQDSIENILSSTNPLTEDERLVAELIIALNTNLTTENQTELKALITQIYDDVLLDDELVVLFGLDATEVEVSKTNTLAMFDELVLQIQTMAHYDFDQLTEEQYQELLAMQELLTAFLVMAI
jgi:hypothetical protein